MSHEKKIDKKTAKGALVGASIAALSDNWREEENLRDAIAVCRGAGITPDQTEKIVGASVLSRIRDRNMEASPIGRSRGLVATLQKISAVVASVLPMLKTALAEGKKIDPKMAQGALAAASMSVFSGEKSYRDESNMRDALQACRKAGLTEDQLIKVVGTTVVQKVSPPRLPIKDSPETKVETDYGLVGALGKISSDDGGAMNQKPFLLGLAESLAPFTSKQANVEMLKQRRLQGLAEAQKAKANPAPSPPKGVVKKTVDSPTEGPAVRAQAQAKAQAVFPQKKASMNRAFIAGFAAGAAEK